jgi:hypothetical protein
MTALVERRRLSALSPREASIFACLCDTVAAPEPVLPAVARTDAVEGFDRMLASAPALNRAALRALLYAAELAPLATGRRSRLRGLPPDERGAVLARLDRGRGRDLVRLLKGLACLSYYGDDGVMRRLGYDADERVETGRRLRAAEGRP